MNTSINELRESKMCDVNFYNKMIVKHVNDAANATNFKSMHYADTMANRAKIAVRMLLDGQTKEQAWKFYQTGSN